VAPVAVQWVGIVSSTGGPRTLRSILARLPASLPAAVLVVQHTVPGFTGRMATWLSEACALRVSIATHHRRIHSGQVVLAPDDRHLEVRSGGVACVSEGPTVASHRPSGTVLLRSLAETFGSGAMGVVLSGIGGDGAEGLRAIEDAGGVAVIEDPANAIAPGMPSTALASTRNPTVAPADTIAATIANLLMRAEA
jgi:two-component system chemotaxis response regulator CheB